MTTALLCETVTGRTMAELVVARDEATHGDMVELRLDGVSDLDVAGALQGRRVPAVVTCRPTWEGGRFDGTEEERARILHLALEAGAEYVDVEWRATQSNGDFTSIVRRDPARIVVSSHDFDRVPSDLDDRVRAMRGVGAGSIKVAVAVSRLSETLALKDIGAGGDAVVIGMGEAGVPSRLLAAHYGSKWTFAGHGVAPGQIPAETMADDYHFFRVGPDTRIFGVVSTNAMHSLSPVMHNAAFEEAGIDAVYVPLRACDFDDFLAYAAAMGVEGASITIPFKLDALRAATPADRLTQTVGAANTLASRREGLASDEHRRGRLSRAARCRVRHASEKRPCGDPRRRRISTRGRGRIAIARRARHRLRATTRAGAGNRAGTRRDGWRVAASGGIVGRAGELHAAWRCREAR